MQLTYFIRTLFLLTAGPLLWAAHFGFIYVLTALVCARPSATSGWASSGALQWITGIATLVVIASILWITLRGLKSDSAGENVRFVKWTALALGVFSIYAIVLDALPVMLVPACA